MTEAEYLAAYRPDAWPRPAVTVDLAIFTVVDDDLKVLLIRRGEHPFRGAWALPGGFVRVGDGDDPGESVDEAAVRELAEETGLPARELYLEQLYTFGDVGRDPRTRVISVAHFALVSPTLAPVVVAGSDAAEVRWASIHRELGGEPDKPPLAEASLLPLAFDHGCILDVALARLRGKLDYAPIAFELVPETFTVAELRGVHEAIKGQTYDAGNFRRRFNRMVADGVIAQAPGKRPTGTKPALVYRFVRGASLTTPRAR